MLDPETEGVLRRVRPAPEPIRCRRPGCKSVYRRRSARDDNELAAGARAAGWRLGVRGDGTPDAICPRDARPDPKLTQLCRDLAASTTTEGTTPCQ